MTDKTSQGIVRDERGQEQPADKDRAQSGKPTVGKQPSVLPIKKAGEFPRHGT